MKLLFITQKLHGQDAFGALWIQALRDRGYDVTVICLEWNEEGMKTALSFTREVSKFEVHSLGKEHGHGKIWQILRFWWLIATLKYDRVFIHMTPVWGLIGAWRWVWGMPVYLWYTHYKMQPGLWMLGLYAKRLFCATPQSLPQYQKSPKKVVVGHGIDLVYWGKCENICKDPKRLLAVHRLSRSKRLELVLHAMALLPDYSLDIYGIEAEKDYAEEMKKLTQELGLSDRVRFHGSILMEELCEIYAAHRLILNMASETIDKTMLEAMTCGCYPVTTKANAIAIGIPEAPQEDSPEAIAAFVQRYANHAPLSPDAMYNVVKERHSLSALVEKMDFFMHSGS